MRAFRPARLSVAAFATLLLILPSPALAQAGDPVDRATEGNMKPLAGDVVIALIRRSCWGPLDDESDCTIGEETAPPYIHLLRRQGEFWVYVYRYRAPD